MFYLSKSFQFEASHRLPYHDGQCARLHGHSWVLTVLCRRMDLETTGPKQGMVMDYGGISEVVKPLVARSLDHWNLNDTLPLESPTSEAIAQWLYGVLKVSRLGPLLYAVRINETCTSECTYVEGEGELP